MEVAKTVKRSAGLVALVGDREPDDALVPGTPVSRSVNGIHKVLKDRSVNM